MITLLIVILVLVAWLMISKNRRQENVTVATHGDALARQYCGSCHLFPEPQLLDKKTWRDGVLPNMAMRLGMRMPGQDPFKGMDTVEIGLVRSLNVYPEQHLISQGEWQQIEDYYTTRTQRTTATASRNSHPIRPATIPGATYLYRGHPVT